MGLFLIFIAAIGLNLAVRFLCDTLGVPHDFAIVIAAVVSSAPIFAYVFRERT